MATITQTKWAQPMGTYKPTATDAMKSDVDFLLTACCGSKFCIHWKHGSNEIVTAKKLDTLKKTHSWMTDF